MIIILELKFKGELNVIAKYAYTNGSFLSKRRYHRDMVEYTKFHISTYMRL